MKGISRTGINIHNSWNSFHTVKHVVLFNVAIDLSSTKPAAYLSKSLLRPTFSHRHQSRTGLYGGTAIFRPENGKPDLLGSVRYTVTRM